jgi:uncharacterized SAM-binding protein YcdF (DUF218 family)
VPAGPPSGGPKPGCKEAGGKAAGRLRTPGSTDVGESAAVGMAIGAAAGFLVRDLVVESLASLWLFGALAGLLLWRTRLRRGLLLLTVALAIAWSVVALTPVAAQLGRGLVRRDSVQKADAIFVFASRLQADGDPTPAALSRIVHGLELLGEGWAPRLVLSELPPPAPSYTHIAEDMMRRLGMQGEILKVGPAKRTRDEAVLVATLCKSKGWKRLLVVTSPTHSRRACAALELEGLLVESSPAAETQFDLQTFDRPVERLLAFRTILHERVGLWYYGWMGWIASKTNG